MMAKTMGLGRPALPYFIALLILVSPDARGVDLDRELILSGLDRPVFMTAPPGDTSRLFVVEQRGVIKIII